MNISLCSFTQHIFSLLDLSFEKEGLIPDYLGIHWRGGEQDTLVLSEILKKELKGIYETLFIGFYQAIGYTVPTILHYITHEERCVENGVTENFYFINRGFNELCKK